MFSTKKNVSVDDEVDAFIKDVKEKYLPTVRTINTQIESIFNHYDTIALRNIGEIMRVLNDPLFQQMLNELEDIPLDVRRMIPVRENNEKLKKQLEKWKNHPTAEFYRKCLSVYTSVTEVKAGMGYLEINGIKYYKGADLYDSKYRLLFYNFNFQSFREEIENYLRKVGVIK